MENWVGHWNTNHETFIPGSSSIDLRKLDRPAGAIAAFPKLSRLFSVFKKSIMTLRQSLHRPISIAVVTLSLFITPCFTQEEEQNLTPEKWLEQFDANKDGKLEKTETSGLMERFFDRNDINKDTFLDGQELQELAGRLARRQTPRPQSNQRNSPGTEQLLARAPDSVTCYPDLSYREGESERWKIDLFVPKARSDTPRPAIVFVHGGGWKNGDKRAATFLDGALEYAEKGYVTATINYRLTGEAPFPACIEDVKCAVRWLRANAEEYNLDPSRIGGYGNSAGAHLVSMLGLVGPEAKLEGDGPHRDQSSLLQAVCASATPTDFSLFRTKPDTDPKWANPGYDPVELAKLSSPITHVKAGAPPFLLIHGTADKTVIIKHGDSFVEALKEAGAGDVTYLRIEDSGHGVYNQHRKQTHPAMEEFFERTLRPVE